MTKRRTQWLLMAGLAVGVAAAGTACDRTVSEKKTTTVKRDGAVIRQSDTVKEKPDGTIVREREREVKP